MTLSAHNGASPKGATESTFSNQQSAVALIRGSTDECTPIVNSTSPLHEAVNPGQDDACRNY